MYFNGFRRDIASFRSIIIGSGEKDSELNFDAKIFMIVCGEGTERDSPYSETFGIPESGRILGFRIRAT
jgi:hypothetical protein